jgi:hypothetical protein
MSAEVLRRSPTRPPESDPGVPDLRVALTYVGGLLGCAGVLCWLVVPLTL